MKRGWHILDDGPVIRVPTPRGAWARWRSPRGEICGDQHPQHANLCSRTPGHTGRHASYGETWICAVWR